MTGNSSHSSNSSSTITQQSYLRRSSEKAEASNKQKRLAANLRASVKDDLPDVFDFMEAASVSSDTTSDDTADDNSTNEDTATQDDDGQSVASSSASSSDQASDAGSSVAPDTPSSQSTFPSPTATRFGSVADLRKKYDAPSACSTSSGRSHNNSPAPSTRSVRKQPSVSDVDEEEDEDAVPPRAPAEIDYNHQRPSSRTSRRSSRSSDRSHYRQDSSRRPSLPAHHPYYVEPVYGQHRSFSNSSAHSDRSAYPYHMAMQQYQWPSPPPMPPQTMNGHITAPERPPVPEAPDLSRRTLTGYEELAIELASTTSPVKPLYRKFEYLNHRILLHLQDELSELEEQLRALDEIIAQMDPGALEGTKSPASRRGDNFYGSDLHLRRTHLLGNIFTKTEQYNRAMAAYTAMGKESAPADKEEVDSYREWLSKHQPIHELETRFLHLTSDLISPRRRSDASSLSSCSTLDRSIKHAALACIPLSLMLPLLLFSVVPTVAGRLLVTALTAVGAFIVAATTRVRGLLSTQEWIVCGAVYVLVMAGVGGCVPVYGK